MQEYRPRQRYAKKKWDTERKGESRRVCREVQCKVRVVVAKAKQMACDELHATVGWRIRRERLIYIGW